MKYELQKIPVREVAAGYKDDKESGCFGYGGKLNIRPAYQREFIYTGKKRESVIESIKKGWLIGVMYWMKNPDGTFEVLDGQQRTISICQYIEGDFALEHFGFKNLTDYEKNQVLDYELSVFVCEGNDKEKLDWFKAINIQGTALNDQELRNAILTGTWLNAAKDYFSKINCSVVNLKYDKYLNGTANRQNYLETALKWISARDKIDIEDYMAQHQHDPNCNDLWLYFKKVMDWVNVLFPEYRREMKGLDWGIYFNKYGNETHDAKDFEERVENLMMDDDVTNNRGIYEYLFDGNERHLSIRKFTEKMRRAAYEKQHGVCAKCGKANLRFDEMEADHIKPWSQGGTTTADNCQMLCKNCNRLKSNI